VVRVVRVIPDLLNVRSLALVGPEGLLDFLADALLLVFTCDVGMDRKRVRKIQCNFLRLFYRTRHLLNSLSS